ncbi:MAG: GNAT family N-acetyltransferase [Bacteroidota bacterium]
MIPLNFRLVTEEDLYTLQTLSIQTFRDTYEALNDPIHFRAYLHRAFSIPQLQKELNAPNSTFYFATLDDAVAGFIKLNFKKGVKELSDATSVELERIYLTKEQQGKGLGAQLIQKAVQVSQEAGFEQIWLGVWKKNPRAIHFYKKNGFQVFDEHLFYVGDDAQEDFLMAKDLRPSN